MTRHQSKAGAPVSSGSKRPYADFYGGLPLLNQLLLGGGALLVGGSVLGTVGPPAARGVATAVHPYTAAGRQETCLSNLNRIGQALALYASDSDGHYPPLERAAAATGAPAGKRTTWVTLLQGQVDTDALSCPLQPVETTQATHLSSYGLNPVLAGFASAQIANPQRTLLLADRGQAHDVSLLPPFPSWPVQTGVSLGERNPSNLAFRHGDQAGVLYADGHAEAQRSGDWLQERETWGAAAVLPVAWGRIQGQYPLLARVEKQFAAGQEQGALGQLRVKGKVLQTATQSLLALWKLNAGSDQDNNHAGTSHDGNNQDEALEKRGWRWAQWWSRVGEREVERELNAEESRRSQQALAHSGGEPQNHSSDWGFAIAPPASWSVTPETDEGYHNTHLRSSSPHIWVLIEKGTRTREGQAAPVQWQGMERELRRRYGALYQRRRVGQTSLGSEVAGDWEFEVQRDGEPRLRRWYVGVSHPWDSYVIACTAPAADFEACRPLFNQIVRSFRFQ